MQDKYKRVLLNRRKAQEELVMNPFNEPQKPTDGGKPKKKKKRKKKDGY